MSRLFNVTTLALGTAVAFAGCSPKADAPPPPPPAAAVQPPPPPPPPMEDPATTKFGDNLKIDIAKMTKAPAGFYWRDLVVGKGARADSGKTLSVFYTGSLSDGTQFETNVGADPIKFPLGMGGVVQGWDQGLAGMKVGGKRQLVIPAANGYGPGGRPPKIPAGAIMVFTVELKGVEK